MKKWPIWVKHIYSKIVIIIGFGIFYFEDLGQLGQFFGHIFGLSMLTSHAPFFDLSTWSSFLNNIFLIAAAIACSMPLLPKIKTFFNENRSHTVYAVGRYGALICCAVMLVILSILLVDATNNPFLYFRF